MGYGINMGYVYCTPSAQHIIHELADFAAWQTIQWRAKLPLGGKLYRCQPDGTRTLVPYAEPPNPFRA